MVLYFHVLLLRLTLQGIVSMCKLHTECFLLAVGMDYLQPSLRPATAPLPLHEQVLDDDISHICLNLCGRRFLMHMPLPAGVFDCFQVLQIAISNVWFYGALDTILELCSRSRIDIPSMYVPWTQQVSALPLVA